MFLKTVLEKFQNALFLNLTVLKKFKNILFLKNCSWKIPVIFSLTVPIKAVLLLWILFCYLCFIFVFVILSIPYAAFWSPAGKGLTFWLSYNFVLCFLVFLSLSHTVSWVMCGTWLYWFLIFAFLFAFEIDFSTYTIKSCALMQYLVNNKCMPTAVDLINLAVTSTVKVLSWIMLVLTLTC